MKDKFINFVEKFYKFMETKEFNPDNSEDREIMNLQRQMHDLETKN